MTKVLAEFGNVNMSYVISGEDLVRPFLLQGKHSENDRKNLTK